jgi:hypothetical protein
MILTINQIVAFNINRLRRARGWTQEHLAKLLEEGSGQPWTEATVGAAERSWRTGRVRQFDANEVVLLARIFRVTVSDLLQPPTDLEGPMGFTAGDPRELRASRRSSLASTEDRQLVPLMSAHDVVAITGTGVAPEEVSEDDLQERVVERWVMLNQARMEDAARQATSEEAVRLAREWIEKNPQVIVDLAKEQLVESVGKWLLGQIVGEKGLESLDESYSREWFGKASNHFIELAGRASEQRAGNEGQPAPSTGPTGVLRVSEQQYRDKIAALKQQEAKLEADLRKVREAAAKHRSDARSKLAKITARTSPSMVSSYEGAAQSAEKKALNEDRKVVAASKKLADVAKALRSAYANLNREVGATERRRRRDEATAAARRRQEDDRRRRQELDHARRVGQAGSLTVRVMHVPVPPAEKLRVLVMTANPVDPNVGTPEHATLWTEREIRDVQRAIERTKHRDRLEFITRPAAQQDDLFDQLNLHVPVVFHFSGHGSEEGIYFEMDDRARDELLSGAVLAEALEALDEPPRIVVLNACDTAITGELIAQGRVQAVVSMAQPIGDTAARVFVAQLYSAIGNGQSLASAFEQGRVKLKMAGLDEDEIPVLTCADGVDAASVVLVEPA